MFEKFTNPARRLVIRAQESARSLHHDHIGTEHILMAVLGDPDTVGATALRGLGTDPDALRAAVIAKVGHGNRHAAGHIPFTGNAKKSLEGSLLESRRLGHSYIGTEHILLGLFHADQGTAATVLSDAGIDLERTRAQISAVLARRGTDSL